MRRLSRTCSYLLSAGAVACSTAWAQLKPSDAMVLDGRCFELRWNEVNTPAPTGNFQWGTPFLVEKVAPTGADGSPNFPFVGCKGGPPSKTVERDFSAARPGHPYASALWSVDSVVKPMLDAHLKTIATSIDNAVKANSFKADELDRLAKDIEERIYPHLLKRLKADLQKP